MAVPTVIAVVADCDDTLAPDTTAQLLEHCGIDPIKFYREDAGKLVDQGYDPVLAYMNAMLKKAKGDGPLSTLTKDKITEIAQKLNFFPGVPEVFEILGEEVHRTYGKWGIRLESFVITAGIEDLISASELEKQLGICGVAILTMTKKEKFPR